jgi:hypothetical protein
MCVRKITIHTCRSPPEGKDVILKEVGSILYPVKIYDGAQGHINPQTYTLVERNDASQRLVLSL